MIQVREDDHRDHRGMNLVPDEEIEDKKGDRLGLRDTARAGAAIRNPWSPLAKTRFDLSC